MPDLWSEWLTHRRQGGKEPATSISRDVARYRDRVLDGAQPRPGEVLLDVGCGDGLVGLGAVDRVGPDLRVVFADISAALLEQARSRARTLKVEAQCTFVQGPAESLPGLADASIDVLTMRSVLVYLPDKPAVAREFHRLLRPGGRLSLAEPIYRDEAVRLAQLAEQLRGQPETAGNLDSRLFLRWKSAQLPADPAAIAASPLTNFDEHDLVTIFEQAGFADIHLELHVDVRPLAPEPWEKILDAAPRPGTPTLREVLEGRFSAEERRHFEGQLRPLAESGRTFYRDVMAYLTARRSA